MVNATTTSADDSFWAWSLPLFRFRGIAIAAHWSLPVFAVYEVIDHYRNGWPLWLTPFVVLIILVSVLLHEFGHAFASRLVGGDCERIVMWMLGGLAECQKPMRPWPWFAVAAAGPLVTAIIVLGAWGALHLTAGRIDPSPAWVYGMMLLGYTYSLNVFLLIFNLLPAFPLDGSKMLFSALWPLVGLISAFKAVLFLSYPIVVALLVYGAWNNQERWLVIALWMLFEIIREHIAWRIGNSFVFGIDLAYAPHRLSSFERWRERRRRRAAAKRDQEAIAEQDLIDHLLAKVGDQGLASLTKQERATLEAYSRKQREKQEVGS